MKKKTREKKQPAGKIAVVLLVLMALVFMLLGPKAKAGDQTTPAGHRSNQHINLPSVL